MTYFNTADNATTKNSLVDDNITVTEAEVGEEYKLTDIKDISLGDFFRAGTDSTSGLVNAQLLVDYDDVMELIDSNCDFNSLRWQSGSDTSSSYNEILVANVIDVLEDNGKYSLYVTADGFADGVLSRDNERFINISSAIIYRVSETEKK